MKIRFHLLVVCLSVLAILVAGCGSSPRSATGSSNLSIPLEQPGIAFFSDRESEGEIYAVSVDGSQLAKVTDFPGRKGRLAFSPDGNWLAFSAENEDEQFEVYLLSLSDHRITRLTHTLLTHECCSSWSPDGTKLAILSEFGGGSAIRIVSSQGDLVSTFSFPSLELLPSIYPPPIAWSPDSKRIAFTAVPEDEIGEDSQEMSTEIYTVNWDGSGLKQLTDNQTQDRDPVWSPDGTKICFQSFRDGNGEVYVMDSDGGGQINLTRHPANDGGSTWSPDGSRILFVSDRNVCLQSYVMSSEGNGQANLVAIERDVLMAVWSPDGDRVALTVREPDRNLEVYVVDSDGTDLINLTQNPAADYYPVWIPLREK